MLLLKTRWGWLRRDPLLVAGPVAERDSAVLSLVWQMAVSRAIGFSVVT